MAYATNADVIKRLPGRSVTVSSKPSTTDIDAWIAEGEAELNAELTMQGFGTPVTDANGILILKAKVVSYATSRCVFGWEIGTGADQPVTAGDLMKEYTDFIALISSQPSKVAAMIGQKPGQSGGSTVLRSYPTDNQDDLSIDNGDFDPVFTRDAKKTPF